MQPLNALALALPQDILANVFFLCLPDKRHERLDSNNAPLLLCKICSSWRQAALGEPKLWDTIIFPPLLPESSAKERRQWTRFIKDGNIDRWFDRTLRAPNHLMSLGEMASPCPSHCLTPSLLKSIAKYGRKLGHLAIVVTKFKHFAALHDILSCDNSNLVSLTICYAAETPPNAKFPMFFKAPNLKSVDLMVSKNSHLSSVSLPWAQLTSIVINNPSNPLDAASYEDIIGRCPNLQRATFRMEPLRSQDWASEQSKTNSYSTPQPLLRPQLKSFSYIIPPLLKSYHAFMPYSNLFTGRIDFTHVEHLHLHYPDQEFVTTRFSLCMNSFPNLKSLELSLQEPECGTLESIPSECIRILQALVDDPWALPNLIYLALPYPEIRLLDVAEYYQSRSASPKHTAVVIEVAVVGGSPLHIQKRLRLDTCGSVADIRGQSQLNETDECPCPAIPTDSETSSFDTFSSYASSSFDKAGPRPKRKRSTLQTLRNMFSSF